MRIVPNDIAIASYFAADKMPTLADEAWTRCAPVPIVRYWSGEDAPPARHAEARVLWTDACLCVRFHGTQAEPLIVSDAPQTHSKTIGLWDRDVCEMFIAPDRDAPQRYFEFEVAPTGEWVDLAIDWSGGERHTNWKCNSGMMTEARVEACAVTMLMRVAWSAFGRPCPRPGDEWRANFLRCVGIDTDSEARGYLAWQPTFTATPNFHVPEVFGTLRFAA